MILARKFAPCTTCTLSVTRIACVHLLHTSKSKVNSPTCHQMNGTYPHKSRGVEVDQISVRRAGSLPCVCYCKHLCACIETGRSKFLVLSLIKINHGLDRLSTRFPCGSCAGRHEGANPSPSASSLQSRCGNLPSDVRISSSSNVMARAVNSRATNKFSLLQR